MVGAPRCGGRRKERRGLARGQQPDHVVGAAPGSALGGTTLWLRRTGEGGMVWATRGHGARRNRQAGPERGRARWQRPGVREKEGERQGDGGHRHAGLGGTVLGGVVQT
jgi:hypothetical protein